MRYFAGYDSRWNERGKRRMDFILRHFQLKMVVANMDCKKAAWKGTAIWRIMQTTLLQPAIMSEVYALVQYSAQDMHKGENAKVSLYILIQFMWNPSYNDLIYADLARRIVLR